MLAKIRVNNNFLNSLSNNKIICVEKINFRTNIFQHFKDFYQTFWKFSTIINI